ncbi:hypothetical protein GXW76_10480 [Roseomonas soli]|uniref:Uncharacterized protein n=1 Tax=Neoroseomonas soli TaxID=1081025 RepID=A0A9X9WWR8_9PROT|nr:hypothetical protein [Neoroseomonas soli]
MSAVHVDGEAFVVDAEDLARAFHVNTAEVFRSLREGILTSRCEKGIDEHEGRHRLIFSHHGRVLRLTVDGEGRILSRVVIARPPGREPGT